MNVPAVANQFPILSADATTAEQTFIHLLPKLRGFLAKRISNAADIDDLAQDILLRVHQAAAQLSDDTHLHAWIWQIARNLVIDYYRRKRIDQLDVQQLDLPAGDSQADIEDIVHSWLAPMIAALPEPYRDAVQLSELDGLTQAEVAARMSISLSGAKSRVQRGRAKLREMMMACCQFDFDRDGKIIAYRKVGANCLPAKC